MLEAARRMASEAMGVDASERAATLLLDGGAHVTPLSHLLKAVAHAASERIQTEATAHLAPASGADVPAATVARELAAQMEGALRVTGAADGVHAVEAAAAGGVAKARDDSASRGVRQPSAGQTSTDGLQQDSDVSSKLGSPAAALALDTVRALPPRQQPLAAQPPPMEPPPPAVQHERDRQSAPTAQVAHQLGASRSPSASLPPQVAAPAVQSAGTIAASPNAQPMTTYRCRKCRTQLFSEAMLESHAVGSGQAAFKPHKRGQPSTATPTCTSHFLSSDAIDSLLQEVEGNLGCPKCAVRIGSYNWAGMKCSCGAWVAPAIQVIKSKVDEVVPPAALPQRRDAATPRGR